MSKKVIAPAAINALKEALTNVYWYKAELRSFIIHTISDTNILSRLDWSDYKRNIVTRLIDFFAKDQATYQNDLLRLMSEVIKIDDFSHLKRLEDGHEKAKKAKESISALRKLCEDHFDLIQDERRKEERREAAYREYLKKEGIRNKIEEIKSDYFSLVSTTDVHSRCFNLEKIMRELFTLFDLDPKASFKIEGEQIDGAFTFDNTDYLFEAKWQQELVGIKELDAFNGKLIRKLENTLGLFLSINGYSEDAVKAYSTGRRLMVLMDGSDLMAVL